MQETREAYLTVACLMVTYLTVAYLMVACLSGLILLFHFAFVGQSLVATPDLCKCGGTHSLKIFKGRAFPLPFLFCLI